MIKVIVNKTIAVRAHALVNKIKRDESIVFCDCCRIDEQVNWEISSVSMRSDTGIGGGGRLNCGGGGSRNMMYEWQIQLIIMYL